MQQIIVEKRNKVRFLNCLLLYLCFTFSTAAVAIQADSKTKLQINFTGLKGVHTDVRVADSIDNSATGVLVVKSKSKNNTALVKVPQGTYDLVIRKGTGVLIIDDVDCTGSSCTVNNIVANLTIYFSGLKGVHVSLHVPDNLNDEASGEKISKKKGQKYYSVITILRQVVDVNVRKGNANIVVDNIDCSSGDCETNNLTATLTVNFPGLIKVNTSVRVPDNHNGSAVGKVVSKLNRKTDQAVITVFRKNYDILVKKGPVSKIIDNVNCTSGACTVNELTARMDIKFPGLFNVHSSVYIPNGVDHSVAGKIAAKSKKNIHQASITLLRQSYDVKVRHAVNSVFDNVDCISDSCEVLVSGNVQAFLKDGDLNTPLANKTLYAYEKRSNGKLKKVQEGKTTDLGQVNFTLENVGSGKVYVLKTVSPFGHDKTYYSGLISTQGEFQFFITEDGRNELDLTPPQVSFTLPEANGNVPTVGFTVSGTANDNRKIDRVELIVNDPTKGSQTITASYDAVNQSWTADVPAATITLNNAIELTATAFDKVQNQSSATVTVTVVEDNEGPEINITSHIDDDQVPVTGFLISGTVTDLTEIVTLKATLQDAILGQTMTDQDVDFSIANGDWTMVVDNGLMTEGGAVDITLDATDMAGNTSFKTIHLLVVSVDYSNVHMISRITFGATPSLLEEVEALGVLDYLDQQLDPGSIDDSAFESNVYGNMPSTKEELQSWTLMHMLYSKRQLQEVMTWFWDNHFNTDINTVRTNAKGKEISNTVKYELAENEAFRANALGNFRTLLGISAKSPAMLIYLDSISNVSGDSNENYAREVDELFTLGVDGGYTQQDVEIGAEIFTGWHVKKGAFYFNNSRHTVDSYTLFAGTPQEVFIPVGGVEQGELLLDALATHPSTAKFICSKLVTLFVNDIPPSTLVTRCVDEFRTFGDADDQIVRVLRVILQSAEFYDTANYRSKIKTPVEFVIGALRHLEATSDATDLATPMKLMGLRLYENPVPTGWSEIGPDWINSGLLIERIKWINKFVRKQPAAGVSASDPMQFYFNEGLQTEDDIVDFLLQLTVGEDFTELVRDNALNVLGENFDLTLPDSEERLQKLNGNVMSNPQYQFQ